MEKWEAEVIRGRDKKGRAEIVKLQRGGLASSERMTVSQTPSLWRRDIYQKDLAKVTEIRKQKLVIQKTKENEQKVIFSKKMPMA